MRYREYLNKRTHLLSLLERGCPGNALQLATMVGISRRTFFDYIQEYREEGYTVKYCKKNKKFNLIR